MITFFTDVTENLPGCSTLHMQSIQSSAAIRDIAGHSDAEYTLIYTKYTTLELGLFALERMIHIAEDSGAGMVYADRYQVKEGKQTNAPVIDYQFGSLRDDFDFGSVLLFRTDAFKEAAARMNEDKYKFAGLYDLRLKVSQNESLVHINEYLYSEIEDDTRKSGEKIFDYVDPRNRDRQIEMEQACTVDTHKLSQYGLTEQTLAVTLFTKGFTTSGGRVKNPVYVQPVYVAKSLNTVRDVQEQIVYTDPMGNNIRLKDVARVVKEYPAPDSYITNNGKKCLLLSIEMKKGKNIVQMGEEINRTIAEFQPSLPSDVNLFSITDQSQVVGDSVDNFLHELLVAIIAVIIVVMLLLPMRVALVAASTIPITIFISLGLFHASNT